MTATSDIKNESFCEPPFYSISIPEDCKNAAKKFSFNADGLIHDVYTTDNQSEVMNLGHCYQQNNQTYFGKRLTRNNSTKVKSFCNPGNAPSIIQQIVV